MLSQRNVVSYLLEKAFLDPEAIVEGEIKILDVSRRNRNFKVLTDTAPQLLLKQADPGHAVNTVLREGMVYQWLQNDAGFADFQSYLPEFVGFDLERKVLLLEYLLQHKTLRVHHARTGKFSGAIAAEVGKMLATLHTCVPETSSAKAQMAQSDPGAPWILQIHHPDLSDLRKLTSGNIEAIKIIQNNREFSENLDALYQEWQRKCLVHFDIKWDNILLEKSAARKPRIRLIDWELAQLGDPAWDIGSVFMDYLGFWLRSIPVRGGRPPEDLEAEARYPLARMQKAMCDFWAAYRRTAGLSGREAWDCLLLSTRFAAARLLQTAYEEMQMSGKLSGNIICFLQVSLNMFSRPEDAIRQLLGIQFDPFSEIALPSILTA